MLYSLKTGTIGCIAAGLLCGCQPNQTVMVDPANAYADAGYRLVWADEFNTNGRPDPNNWTYEHGFVRNEEQQWYQPENAFCEDGWLIIEARRQSVPNPRYEPGSRNWRRRRQEADYTSACLKTISLHEWLYGRFEIRAKIQTQDGLWPAIWTLGRASPWPACGEIDIMEYYDDSILANACWAEGRRRRAVWDTVKKPVSKFNDPDWGDKVHIWRMDWDENAIKLYVDDELLNTIEIEKTVNPRTGITPFRRPHYLLLNLAIGGTRGGDPSQTPFPSQYKIDYVRIYQKQ